MLTPSMPRAILVFVAAFLVAGLGLAQTSINTPGEQAPAEDASACEPLLPEDYGLDLEYSFTITLDSDLLKGLFDLVSGYVRRGDALVDQGQDDQASRYYTYAVNYLDYLFNLYNDRAVALTGEGELQLALADYVRAYTLAVNLAEVLSRRGLLSVDSGAYADAVNDVNRALELVPQLRVEPGFARAFFEVGHAEERQGNFSRAVFAYTRAIAIQPDYADAYVRRARAYHRLAFYTEAIDDLSCVVELEPDYAPAYQMRGRAYAASGNYARAVEDHTAALNMNARLSLSRIDRGLAYLKLDDYVKAITDLTWAIIINPNDPDAYNLRGMAYYDIQLYREASADYVRAIQLDPDRPEFYNNLAWAQLALNRSGNAHVSFAQFLLNLDYTLPRAVIEVIGAASPAPDVPPPAINTEARG